MRADDLPLHPVNALRIMTAVRACPVVADMSSGRYGEVATYLSEQRVPGVRVHDHHIDVHVIAVWGPTLAEVAEQVHRAVLPLAYGREVHVVVESLSDSGEDEGEGADAGRG